MGFILNDGKGFQICLTGDVKEGKTSPGKKKIYPTLQISKKAWHILYAEGRKYGGGGAWWNAAGLETLNISGKSIVKIVFILYSLYIYQPTTIY